MEAEIYSKTNCGYCDRAKLRLAKYNPKIYMLDTDYTREDFFEKFPNAKTFPQIILNGEKIGGYHELEKWFEMMSSLNFKVDGINYIKKLLIYITISQYWKICVCKPSFFLSHT